MQKVKRPLLRYHGGKWILELAEAIHRVKGMVIISGYGCSLYDDELFPEWRRVERNTHADGAKDRIEVLWTNSATGRNLLPLLKGVI